MQKKKRIFVNLSTNSNFLSEETTKKLIESGLDELIVSLDGASEETYNKYRKSGDFKKVINSIKLITSEKRKLQRNTPFLKVQFIIMKHNEHEINKIKSLAREIGADELAFKTVGIMDYSSKENIKKYLPENKKYSRYEVNNKGVKPKVKIANWCDSLWNEVVINWDGTVVPCCFDMNNSFVFGDIKKEKIKAIWNSKKYQSFRRQILMSKKQTPLCKNCPGTNKETFIDV